MPRQLSPAFVEAVNSRETGEVFIHLLKLSHSSLSEPILVCDDSIDVVSEGRTYTAFPFELTMASEVEDAPPQGRLRICGSDGTIIRAARTLSGPALIVSLSLVRASAPDMIEIGPVDFSLRDVSYDSGVVEGTLRFDDYLNEPFPADRVTPSNFPGLSTVI